MKLRNVFIIVLIGIVVGACNVKIAKKDNVSKQEQKYNANIPYKLANGYFVNNDITGNISTKITSQTVLEKYFGLAAVMGKDGEPTKIDFNKEYVIAISKKETDFSTELSPISLTKDNYNNIVFTYKLSIGEKQSYTIVPCLLIIVNNKYKGNIILKEEK